MCRALENRRTTVLGELDSATWSNTWNRSHAIYWLEEQHENEDEDWGNRDHDDDDDENEYAVSNDARVDCAQ